MATRQITVAKITEEELDQLRDFLRDLGDVLNDNQQYDDDDSDVNKEIADAARKLPQRAAWLAPLNLDILLHNYQDKESSILAHGKWIQDMIDILKEVDSALDCGEIITTDGALPPHLDIHKKIKAILKED